MKRVVAWLLAVTAFLIVGGGSVTGVRADGFLAEDGIGFCGFITDGPGKAMTSVLPEPNGSSWHNRSVSVRASWMIWCSERIPHTVDYKVTGAESRSGEVEIPTGPDRVTGYRWDISHEGLTTVELVLKDAAGNDASERERITVRIDRTAPLVAVTGVRHGAIYELGAVPMAGCTTHDALSGVAANATLVVTGASEDGTGRLTATCRRGTDVAGNIAMPASVTYTVVPAGSGPRASITTNKTDYRVGEMLTFCFTVPGPGPITITDRLADGRQNVIVEWIDDGRGACLTGIVTPPTGRECLRLEYTGPGGSASAETCFSVGG